MIKLGLKYSALAILVLTAVAFHLFVAYKAAIFYSGYKAATYARECTSLAQICELAEQKASNGEITAAMARAFSCMKNKQSFIEAYLLPIPEEWSNPPPESVSYRDAEKSCNRHRKKVSG